MARLLKLAVEMIGVLVTVSTEMLPLSAVRVTLPAKPSADVLMLPIVMSALREVALTLPP